MAAKTMTVDPVKLSEQLGELLVNGGTLGDTFGYDERDYEVLYALGHSLYSQGRYTDAVKAFGFLVANNHLERRYAAAYAAALQMNKQYREAIEFYTLASMWDMGDPVPTFHTAECMIALGMLPEAREALEIVIRQCKEPHHAALKDRADALLAAVQPKGGA